MLTTIRLTIGTVLVLFVLSYVAPLTGVEGPSRTLVEKSLYFNTDTTGPPSLLCALADERMGQHVTQYGLQTSAQTTRPWRVFVRSSLFVVNERQPPGQSPEALSDYI